MDVMVALIDLYVEDLSQIEMFVRGYFTKMSRNWIHNIPQGTDESIGGHLKRPSADSFDAAVHVGASDMISQCFINL